jgi:RNA recognition motif-containing protein
MSNRLRVGNLGFTIDLNRLKEIFSVCGSVSGATIAESPYSGTSRGFGFVEMSTDEEAQVCVLNLHGKEIDGRVLTVVEASPEKKAHRIAR